MARDLIPSEMPAEQFLLQASPKAVTAWQQLPKSLAVVDQIAQVAAMFGTKQTALWPLIEPYSLGEARLVDDRALWVCDGSNLALDSQPFGRPDSGGRTSPYFKTSLRLHTVESATERYRQLPKPSGSESILVHATRCSAVTASIMSSRNLKTLMPQRFSHEQHVTRPTAADDTADRSARRATDRAQLRTRSGARGARSGR